MDNYRIVMRGPGRGEVFRNGEKVENVIGIEFSAGVNELNRITLTFIAGEVEIEAEADAARDVTDIGDDSRKFAKA